MPLSPNERLDIIAGTDSFYAKIWAQFYKAMLPLELKPEEVSGDVLVVGPSRIFPEITLVTNDEFTRIDQRIRRLVLCDSDPTYLRSQNFFGRKIVDLDWNKIPSNPRAIYTKWAWEGEFFKYLPEDVKFNTILAFRLPTLEDDLCNGMIDRICSRLSSGGRFICSGTFDTQNALNLNHNLPEGMTINRTVELQNPSPFGDWAFPFGNYHLGVVVDKASS